MQGLICHYYVDESGSGVLFNKRGKLLLNKPDSSKFFILGLLEVADPQTLSSDMDSLRCELLNDPYFKDVPSMKPEKRKTALLFHAKDDLPEVRREVLKLLLKHEMKFFAVVKSMWAVYNYVAGRNLIDPSYRYHPNELYDLTVRRLFKERLHTRTNYNIHFAWRSRRSNTERILEQLSYAKERFLQQRGSESRAEIKVRVQRSHEEEGLQAVDYFLWALQRLYERREDRYISFIWDKVSLIQDVDDTREHQYGMYYTKKKPLTLAALPSDWHRI